MNLPLNDPFWLTRELIAIGVALSAEKEHGRLLEMILDHAGSLTNADGGTLYSLTDAGELKFEIMHTRSLDIRMGGTSGVAIPHAPIPLVADGRPNNKMVAVRAAFNQCTINVEDAYTNEEYDFSGTRAFDQRTGYHSTSLLTVPMTNHESEVIGVLQLLNKHDPVSGEVVAFPASDQRLVEALASMAAVTISNKLLIESQRELFDSFIRLIAAAIDEKSPHTAGHCRRVPALTNLLADAVCATTAGPLAEFTMTPADRYELNVAAWLHDCGKITTPEYIIDKSTKLETIFDRIELIDARFELLKRDAEIAALKRQMHALYGGRDPAADEQCRQELAALDAERDFIRRCNIGSEFLSDDDKQRIAGIAARIWRNGDGRESPLLSTEEVYNLQVSRGTLTTEEREIINNHMVATIRMLESLPYPRHLRRVPEYACGHHERMDGRGFPRGLTRAQMSVPARMMAIADIFEALTASDRPYKTPMPLSQALTILGRMKLGNHIDPDLFEVFIRERVYLKYAQEFLAPAQVDDVDLTALPGYNPDLA